MTLMIPSMFDLSGKVAIVTGSTKGIGRAMVSGLAAAGASVVVSSRKQALCDTVVDEVRAQTGAEVLGLACHVGEWDAIPAFVDAVLERFGRVDVLVNNAGINPAPVTTSDMTLEYWRKVFAVNLEGPLRMSQCVAPIMRDGGGGSIVNIATMAAYSGGPNVCAYGASKAALVNLTKSNAREWAPWRVRVNALSPGPIDTPILDGLGANAAEVDQIKAGMATQVPLGRMGTSDEIAKAALFLASDDSSYVNGVELFVDGGMAQV